MPTESDQPRGERALVADIRRLLRTPAPGGPPPGDDLAAICPDGPEDLLWSADLLMDGVDFDSRIHDWAGIGAKALKVNLSDCAACGTRPVSCLLSLSLCNDLDYESATRLVQGLVEVAGRYDCPLMGGDTNSWDQPTAINVTVAARPVPGTRPVLRRGARPGDLVCLSGPVGGSLLGRHLTFEPRVALGLDLARLPATAMIDVSDGVAIDLWHLCDESGCGAVIDPDAIDRLVHPDAHRRAAGTGWPARDHALYDGEDFELIATVDPATPPTRLAELGLQVFGRMTATGGVVIGHGAAVQPVPRRGWEHFT